MAFEPAAALIGLREGMEIFLVLGILLGILDRLGQRHAHKHVWVGFGAGILTAAIGGGIIVSVLFELFEERGGAAVFEIIVALAAVAVLTWMVLWMQRHAHTMVTELRERTELAAETGSWFAIGFLAYVTVLREGLEVVLFYTALAADATWGDLILAGLLGFGASAVIAFLLFRAIVNVDVKRFFAVSGILIVFIAAGLLVHVIHAASDLGWLPHGAPLWDTSNVLPDEDHWLGGPLHAFIGYEDQPTALQLLIYLGYLFGVGGWYVTRLTTDARRARVTTTTVAVGVALLFLFSGASAAGFLPGAGTAHDDEGEGATDHHFAGLDHAEWVSAGVKALDAQEDVRVGLFVRQHGEWVHYNASTYESVKAFIDGIWPYTGLPPELLEIDQGTYYIDDNHPWSDRPETDVRLVDAWLSEATLPAAPVVDPIGGTDADERLAGGHVYMTPGAGPGLGEGDLYELFGLGSYRTWLKMDNHSPMYADVQASWDYLRTHVEKHYGDRVHVEFGFHVDPKMDPSETIHAAAKRLAAADVDIVIDAYQSSLHSDAMNTCMMAPHAEHALRAAGFEGEIVPIIGSAGLHAAWAEGTARQVETLIAELDPETPIAIHLAQHGIRPGAENPCGEGPEAYNLQTQAEFALAYAAIHKRFPDRDITIRQVYGQGADASDDNVLAGWEALDLDATTGIERTFVIPYEFWGNGMDNLVALRESYNVTTEGGGHYDNDHTTNGTTNGVEWTITDASAGLEAKGTALLAQIDATIARVLAAVEDAGEDPATA